MTLNEALRKADEAEKEMYCGQWPQAVIALAKEVKKLQRKLKKADNLVKEYEEVLSGMAANKGEE